MTLLLRPCMKQNPDTSKISRISSILFCVVLPIVEPRKLLHFTKTVQREIGRVERFRNGPREIDIDLLFYDNIVYKDEELEIPHPRLQERDFVLQPFADLNPDFSHPILNKTIRELLDILPEEQRSIIRMLK